MRDTLRSLELGVRLPKSQSHTNPSQSIAIDYRLHVIRFNSLVVAFPVRMSLGAAFGSNSPTPLTQWLHALHDAVLPLQSFLTFLDSQASGKKFLETS